MVPSAARVAGIASAVCTRVSTRPNFFLGRVEPWVGFKDIYLLLSDSQTQVNTRCCCGQNRVQFYFSARHAPRTPSDWLGGSVLGLLLLSYTHIIHTYISDRMHQVVAGPGGNTIIDIALLTFYGYKRYDYIRQGFGSPQTQYQALNTTSNPWKILPRTPHIPKLLPPTNKLLYNIRERLTLAGQPYPLPLSANTCDALYSNEHYSTYCTQHPLTTNNSFARTSAQRAPTAITLSPLSATLSSEQCTSSCYTFPITRAVEFIYVSTRITPL